MVNEVKRGDIFYVENEMRKAACEQEGIRPAVIIQNDVGNIYSPTVIVAFLTTKNKKMMPTHVHTDATPRPSIAMCEQIATISKERLKNYVGHFSDREMKQINEALKVSLSIH